MSTADHRIMGAQALDARGRAATLAAIVFITACVALLLALELA